MIGLVGCFGCHSVVEGLDLRVLLSALSCHSIAEV